MRSLPPSKLLTGPATPRRSVCAPGLVRFRRNQVLRRFGRFRLVFIRPSRFRALGRGFGLRLFGLALFLLLGGELFGVFQSQHAGGNVRSCRLVDPVAAGALVTNRTVVFGDLAGFIYGLDVNTGAEKWKIRPNPHPTASIFGSPTMFGPYVAIGVALTEELVALQPGYVPTFRGSVVLLNPADGQVIRQTYTITDVESAAGAADEGHDVCAFGLHARGLLQPHEKINRVQLGRHANDISVPGQTTLIAESPNHFPSIAVRAPVLVKWKFSE